LAKLTLTLVALCKKAPGWGGRCQAEFTQVGRLVIGGV